MKLSCIIPTFNGEKTLEKCLASLKASSLCPEIWIVDSGSTDRTLSIVSDYGISTIVHIPKAQFSHGGTREMMRKKVGGDIVFFITQDAELNTPDTFRRLIEPLLRKEAAVSYARQLPRKEAGFIEKEARLFNYPKESELRSSIDLSQRGTDAFFCSNSAAAWHQESLNAIGGFKAVSFGEDSEACLRLLLAGKKVAYVADAEVIHSHNHTLLEEYRRSKSIGATRKALFKTSSQPLSDMGRGTLFAKHLLKKAFFKAPWQIPYILTYLAVRFFGYTASR